MWKRSALPGRPVRGFICIAALWFLAGVTLPAAVQDTAQDAVQLNAQDGGQGKAPRLTYIKAFPRSNPEYVRITVTENGAAIFQEGTIAEPGEEEPFEVSAGNVTELFRLASELGNFREVSLETGRRVARMGEKTFRYENGADRWETTYNHTQNRTAAELQGLFDRIAGSRHALWVLGHKAQFDRLGMAEALREFDRLLSDGELTDLEQFLPVLKKIAGDARLMRLARIHAERLAARLEDQSAHLQLEFGSVGENRFISVQVNQEGAGTVDIRRFDQKPDPKPLQIPPPLNARLWELAELSDSFRDEKSSLPAAGKLAGYRLTYEKGTTKNVVAFSSPRSGVLAEVINILQRVIQQQYHLKRVREAAAENSFMLQVVLQELERSVTRNQLADPDEFVPLLEQIAGGQSFHELDRELAGRILRRIRFGARRLPAGPEARRIPLLIPCRL